MYPRVLMGLTQSKALPCVVFGLVEQVLKCGEAQKIGEQERETLPRDEAEQGDWQGELGEQGEGVRRREPVRMKLSASGGGVGRGFVARGARAAPILSPALSDDGRI